jgi:hypothetical protein
LNIVRRVGGRRSVVAGSALPKLEMAAASNAATTELDHRHSRQLAHLAEGEFVLLKQRQRQLEFQLRGRHARRVQKAGGSSSVAELTPLNRAAA